MLLCTLNKEGQSAYGFGENESNMCSVVVSRLEIQINLSNWEEYEREALWNMTN